MNLQALHHTQKGGSTKLLFKTSEGPVTALKILENAQLNEHSTKVPALFVCTSGKVVFENGLKQQLSSCGYIHIEPYVKHGVKGVRHSKLLLIK